MLRFEALGLVLIIAPSFKLGIVYHFFSWIPYSSRNILSNFQDFLQPVRPVDIRFSRFIESAGVKHYMTQAHELQIGFEQCCGPILGLDLGSLQPTTNPYGFLVVKQAEN